MSTYRTHGIQVLHVIVGMLVALISCFLHGCGGVLTSSMEAGSLVEKLNSDFRNPPSATGIPGVVTRYINLREADGSWNRTEMKFYCGSCDQGYNKADCKTLTSSLNAKWSVWFDRVMRFGLQIDNSLERGGLYIFDTQVIQDAVRCSFSRDGASDSRSNFGCGCPAREPTDNWERNACLNEDKDNVDACHCSSTDQSLEVKDPKNIQDPVAHGACYWRGPAFYKGQGKGKFADQRDAADEIASFTEMNLKVDHEKIESGFGADANLYGRFFWNEIVLDNTILEGLMPNAVVAIALGVGGSHAGIADDTTIQVARDLAHNIGDNVKVIGYDDSNKEAPFIEL